MMYIFILCFVHFSAYNFMGQLISFMGADDVLELKQICMYKEYIHILSLFIYIYIYI